MNLAENIINVYNKWDNTDKSVMADNIEKYLYAKYPECEKSFNDKMNKLIDITGAKRDSIYSWLNRSRKNIRTPFIQLCKIAVALDVDITDMFEVNNENKR